MSFDFREDTPAEVLAAFSSLERPLDDGASWGPAPRLPAPVVEPVEWWVPDWRETGETDVFEHEPWRHDWGASLSNVMSGSVVPLAALSWTGTKRWNLAFRCSLKSWADAIFAFLQWLGPFIHTWGNDGSRFVGYIADEQALRPYLLWAQGGRLTMENLNAGAQPG